MGYQKGHWGEYSGNAKWSKDHAHTKVTKENYKASVKDDAAHIDYLKRDVLYDDHHGHSDEKMTADEKHISKLAGDMKYDKEHHGSPAHHVHKNTHSHTAYKAKKGKIAKKINYGASKIGGEIVEEGLQSVSSGVAEKAAEKLGTKQMLAEKLTRKN